MCWVILLLLKIVVTAATLASLSVISELYNFTNVFLSSSEATSTDSIIIIDISI